MIGGWIPMWGIVTQPIAFIVFVTAALAVLILSASIPQAASAASDAGVWKVDPAQSKFNSRSATLTIQRVEGGSSTRDSFIVISGEGVYRVTGSAAANRGFKPADFTNMTRTGEAVLIGTHPHSTDACGYKCRAGLPEPVRTVTFNIVKSGEQQIRDMLAYDDQNW
jgi:hypothetical protein